MLPIENETKSVQSPDLDGENERSAKANEQNVGTPNGGKCNNEIRVKIVAEINKDYKADDVLSKINAREGTRKRSTSIEEASSSKRNKFSESDNELPETTCTENMGSDGCSNNQETDGGSLVTGEESLNISSADNSVRDAVQDPESDVASSTMQIKQELGEATEQQNEENTSNEVRPSGSGTSNPVDIKPAIKVEKMDASSTSRESCRFGIRCYRQNPMHRIEEAHPGDHDYKRPSYPPPPDGTPDCPYGDKCYRRNPVHFEQYNHPLDTDFEQNYKNHRMRLRQRRAQVTNEIGNASGNSSDVDDEYDLEDPFIDDEDMDSDYIPSDNENEEDYDECDRAEE